MGSLPAREHLAQFRLGLGFRFMTAEPPRTACSHVFWGKTLRVFLLAWPRPSGRTRKVWSGKQREGKTAAKAPDSRIEPPRTMKMKGFSVYPRLVGRRCEDNGVVLWRTHFGIAVGFGVCGVLIQYLYAIYKLS